VALAIAPIASQKPIASSSLNAVKTGSVALLWASIAVVAFWNLNVYESYTEVITRVRDSESYSSSMLQEAAAELDPIIAADPYQAAYIANQAYMYGMAAHYNPDNTDALNAGIDTLERYTMLEPTHSVGWANLAGLYWQAEQPDRALDAVNRAIELSPEWDFYRRMRDIYTGELPAAETVIPPKSPRAAGTWYNVQMIRMYLSPVYLPQVGYGADRTPIDVRWNAPPEDTASDTDDASTDAANTTGD
jgi:tetratricopeptide (TPR) repeat protein